MEMRFCRKLQNHLHKSFWTCGDLYDAWPWHGLVIISTEEKITISECTPATVGTVEKSSGLQIEDNGTLCTASPVNDCLATWGHWWGAGHSSALREVLYVDTHWPCWVGHIKDSLGTSEAHRHKSIDTLDHFGLGGQWVYTNHNGTLAYVLSKYFSERWGLIIGIF